MLMHILQLAPSAQPRRSRELVPVAITGPRHVEFGQSARAEGLVCGPRAAITSATGERSEPERGGVWGRPGNWRQPPKMPIQGMAPSSYHRIIGHVALAPIAGPAPLGLRQVTWVKAVAPGPNDNNHLRERRIACAGDRGRTGG